MGNTSMFKVVFLVVNVIVYLRNASSCKSNGPHSPAIDPSGTRGILTLNNFGPGGDGGGPSECDGRFHPLPERVVALSTGWFSEGARCGRTIRIKAANGRSTLAKVVDQCDSVNGCQSCKTNVVDASQTVWNDLRLITDDGEVPITWTIA